MSAATAVREIGRAMGQVGLVGASLAAERVRPPAPSTRLDDVPISADHLTVEWLTAALCADVPGAHVVAFRLGEGSDGTSSRRAVEVDYDDVGTAAGLPRHVYTKSSPNLSSRLFIGITGAAAAEVLFYTRIRPQLDAVGAPEGYGGAIDARSARSMVLMEDIATTRGATFGNAAIHVDRPAAESMVREMAAYHGAMWEDPRLAGAWGVRDALTWQEEFNARTGWKHGATYGLRRAAEVLPPELLRRRAEVWPTAMRSIAAAARGPQTLLHQDTHPANWFRLPDGTLHLYDWQAIARGSWALDYTYALTAALEIADRRAWERDLLALYVEELARAGGPTLTVDEALAAYRQQMWHGFIFWTFTIGVQKVSRELQPHAHCLLILERIGAAIVDHDALDAVPR